MAHFNSYARVILDIYDKVPKAVLAAIIVSEHLNKWNTPYDDINGEILKEWQALWDSGIVPQKPPRLNNT